MSNPKSAFLVLVVLLVVCPGYFMSKSDLHIGELPQCDFEAMNCLNSCTYETCGSYCSWDSCKPVTLL